jgi:hypothetical protein
MPLRDSTSLICLSPALDICKQYVSQQTSVKVLSSYTVRWSGSEKCVFSVWNMRPNLLWIKVNINVTFGLEYGYF